MKTTTSTTNLVSDCSFLPLAVFPQPKAEDFPAVCFKNFRQKRALDQNLTPYCRKILSYILGIPSEFKHTYIDVKVHDLKKGGSTTQDGYWHLDSSLNGEREYRNYLFVSGEHALTEFITSTLIIPPMPDVSSFNDYVSGCCYTSVRIPSCTVVAYSGKAIHRSPIATGDEKRLLLRVIKTNRQEMPNYYFNRG